MLLEIHNKTRNQTYQSTVLRRATLKTKSTLVLIEVFEVNVT